MPAAVTWLGHASTLVELDGARVVIDPVLRGRVAHLSRRSPSIPPASLGPLDAVLITHQHLDHLDLPTLRRLQGRPVVIAPAGSGGVLRRAGLGQITELGPGETRAVGALHIEATPALHDGRRLRHGPARPALGFVLGTGPRVYHAGDTDLFDGMAAIGAAGLDVALLPIWGWGSTLGPGHLDPARAARAAALLAPRVCVPIHYGTYAPGLRAGRRPAYLREPLVAFLEALRTAAPGVEGHPLAIGEVLRF
jgi:L-ascorbate metabolism protein UlaG (beta-lactamase superfamily)